MGYAKIRPRRGTEAEWSLVNPILAEGELVMVCPDSGVGTGLTKFKIGDGITKYQDLPYAFDGTASHTTGGTVGAYSVISLRGGTLKEWLEYDPVLDLYEVVFDSTTYALKVGDGVSTFSQLAYIGDQFDGDYGDEDIGYSPNLPENEEIPTE